MPEPILASELVWMRGSKHHRAINRLIRRIHWMAIIGRTKWISFISLLAAIGVAAFPLAQAHA